MTGTEISPPVSADTPTPQASQADKSESSSTLKIAFVCNPKMGGSGIIATELAMALAERGHHVWLLAEKHPFSWRQVSDTLHFLKLEVNDYPVFESAPHTLALAGGLANLVEQEGIDVVHAHYAVPYAAAAVFARQICKQPFKLITTLHGTDVVKLADDPAMHRVIDTVLEQSHRVICVSDDLAQQTHQRFSLKTYPDVIANFVPKGKVFNGTREDARNVLGLDQQACYLVHASNFRKIKRIPDIIETFAQVRQQKPCQLILLGEGPEFEPAQAQAKQLGVFEDIIWVGKDPEINRWFAAANVNLQLSDYESFGLTLIESMVQGVPTVANDVGGMPEVVAGTGEIVSVGDTQAAAAAVLTLMNQQQAAAQAVQQRCIEKANNHYTSDAVCLAHEVIYDSILNTLNES
ncbi:N-acetyl-alpha-D-glucosaminyl L-malate synthase BshA [Neiella marina]|uniref:N-acetyl-alpha-D-glucosaminyl L-malate synthase BshA n=1 Tax=Neiella holothuriorum TaxID=2870530 RepID=A0ABS7ECA9_9GAMM|nr:N-acetyl-alpha-D-glucosaminyl L-malate synthase BshA [Neiella holothuriorum]MBW8189931.1 N-acetyl-alpha-D-glucosaminyl L-malate synthase BshA [Neiella holothuriorum]